MRFSLLASLALASSLPSTAAFTSSGLNRHSQATRVPGIVASKVTPARSSSTVFSAVEDEVVTTSAGKTELDDDYSDAFTYAQEALKQIIPEHFLPVYYDPCSYFIREYLAASQVAKSKGEDGEEYEPKATADRILNGIKLAVKFGVKESPVHYKFGVTHRAMRGEKPEYEDGNKYDFYDFGCDFFRPCMDMKNSKIMGLENLEKAKEQLANGDNVVFFANHQSEADPQVVSVGLESVGLAELGADLTYVAGHKVTTDPLAVPFSMGRNLICIHSKKHINADPETKGTKQKENLKAMGGMLDLLKAGGCGLWVAPSGGRDRRDLESGTVPIATFDSKTIDMFRLMGNKSKKPTHYYTLAMVTYDLCPPPDFVVPGVGEERNVRYVPIGLNVGKELVSEGGLEKRHTFNEDAFHQCQEDYDALLKEMSK